MMTASGTELDIRQFRYSRDNLAYLVYGGGSAVAIDGGAVEEILTFVADNNLVLRYVTHTHQHADHTCGTRELAAATGARPLDFGSISADELLPWEGAADIEVWPAPGHTLDSVVFKIGSVLISGDTLFNGTVGNCFSGDLHSFYHTIQRIMELDDDTVIYAGHDYVRESIAFARHLEPDNAALDGYLARYDAGWVRSTLGMERTVNPYLRFNEPALVRLMEKRGLAVASEYDRWQGVMHLD